MKEQHVERLEMDCVTAPDAKYSASTAMKICKQEKHSQLDFEFEFAIFNDTES